MFGMSLAEILLILVVVLIVLGPERLPELARMLGKGMREVRRASNMFRDTFMLEDQQSGRRPDQMLPTGEAPDPPSADPPEPNQSATQPAPHSVDQLGKHSASLASFEAVRLVDLPAPANPDVTTLNSVDLPARSPDDSGGTRIALDPPVPASVW